MLPSGLETRISMLNSILHAVLILYVVGVTFTTLAVVFNIVSMLFPTIYPYRIITANACLSVSAALFVLLGSIVTTIATVLTSDALDDVVGIRVVRGLEFLNMTWGAFGITTVATLYWVRTLMVARRGRR